MEECSILWFGMYRQLWENKSHSHNFFQLFAVMEGTGTITIGETVYTVKPGQLYLAGPGQLHSVIGSGSKPLEIRDVKFNANNMTLCSALLRRTGCIIPKHFGRFVSCFENIVQETLNAKPYYLQMINLSLYEILVYILRENETECSSDSLPAPQSGSGSRSIVLASLLEYIQANHQRAIGLDELCAVARVNKTTLTELFKAHLQVTPIRYVNLVRMEHAKSLLTKTDTTVSEIAYSCGFQSIHYFCRIFRAFEGCTPAQYRNTHANSFFFQYS